ncbi:hypothetical protein [Actinoplanes sp. NPDC051411]|uniref:hypothetical protein n=1 Tax=Actinoplanes sp. NPDC051411 TaxID=3155522 RepID=UPI003424C8A1
MPQQQEVESGLPDLSGVSFAHLVEEDPGTFERQLAEFLRRIDEPSQTISGYNPQRLD